MNWIVNDNNLEGSDDKKEEPADRKSSVCVCHARQSVYYVTKYLKSRNKPSYIPLCDLSMDFYGWNKSLLLRSINWQT